MFVEPVPIDQQKEGRMVNEADGHEAFILLVDDDAGDQELTGRALGEDVVKTKLRIVSNGEEAMRYLNRVGRYTLAETSPRPDLILLDLNMPGMDGRQVLAALRADPDLDSIPVVVLTTSEQEEDILRSYELGCSRLSPNLLSLISSLPPSARWGVIGSNS